MKNYRLNQIHYPFQPTLTNEGAERFGLEIEYTKPCQSLAGKVITYLHVRANHPTPYPVIPDGTQAIYISQHGAFVGGPGTNSIDMQLPQAGEYFGIWFHPGALRHWFNVDLSEISGQLIDGNLLPKHKWTELLDVLYESPPCLFSSNIFDGWLLKHFRENANPKLDHAMLLITQSIGNEKIARVANAVGWSGRNLHRHFLKNTGLAAKQFAQIIRLHHTCRYAYKGRSNPSAPLPGSGYYDQSHLIKAFNKYFAAPPGPFFDRFMSDLYNP